MQNFHVEMSCYCGYPVIVLVRAKNICHGKIHCSDGKVLTVVMARCPLLSW